MWVYSKFYTLTNTTVSTRKTMTSNHNHSIITLSPPGEREKEYVFFFFRIKYRYWRGKREITRFVDGENNILRRFNFFSVPLVLRCS